MKSIFFPLCFFFFSLSVGLNAQERPIPTIYQGDALLVNDQLIYEINNNCLYGDEETEEDKKNCTFFQLTSSIAPFINNDLIFENIRYKVADFGDGNVLTVMLNREYEPTRIYLEFFIEKNSEIKSSTIASDFLSGDYEHIEQFHFLANDNLYILNFLIGEEGYKGNFWKKYLINFKNGTFDLIESISCADKRDATGEVIYTIRESTIRECAVDK